MRITHRYLYWDNHPKIVKSAKKILDKYNISYKYEEDLDNIKSHFKYTIEFYLFEDNPHFNDLKIEIDKFKINPQPSTIYEKSDIETAEWFIITTGQYQYPQPEDYYLESTFNLDNHCKICGIGRIQNAPFRLKTEPKQLNNQFWGLHWLYDPIFVREETKNIMEREKIQGIKFSAPALHKKNIKIERFYQLHIHCILDKGFDSYNTKTITCKINNEEDCNTNTSLKCCGRTKFHNPRVGGYCFDKKIFNNNFDIVQSHEYFGSGARANKINIVSTRFKRIVESNKLKGLSFTPIVHKKFVR
jgi:hypothetical protein